MVVTKSSEQKDPRNKKLPSKGKSTPQSGRDFTNTAVLQSHLWCKLQYNPVAKVLVTLSTSLPILQIRTTNDQFLGWETTLQVRGMGQDQVLTQYPAKEE